MHVHITLYHHGIVVCVCVCVCGMTRHPSLCLHAAELESGKRELERSQTELSAKIEHPFTGQRGLSMVTFKCATDVCIYHFVNRRAIILYIAPL